MLILAACVRERDLYKRVCSSVEFVEGEGEKKEEREEREREREREGETEREMEREGEEEGKGTVGIREHGRGESYYQSFVTSRKG